MTEKQTMAGDVKEPCVYIMASRMNGTLYTGVTADITQRALEHRSGAGGFTAKHNVKKLVYMAFFETIDEAIEHEKRLKKWRRVWKIRLIEEHNPEWRDLFETVQQ